MHTPTTLTLAIVSFAAPALAQTNIHPDHRYAWQENTGWMNWRDAGAGAQGVRVHASYLSGFIWSENAGWISVGDGTPGSTIDGRPAYANTTGADHGVNIAPSGDLSGFAWGENIGWINFGTPSAAPHHARFDRAAGRFRGYAWGENVGWINLDDPTHYVAAATCAADFDNNGVLTLNDFVQFRNAYVAGNLQADFDGSGTLTLADFIAFRNAYVAGCS